MSSLQEPVSPVASVLCDFYFTQAGPAGHATYDGNAYPYPPLPSDKENDYRYAWGTTPILLSVEFFAQAHIVEGKTQPHVIAPPGVTILKYFWNFGDGYTGFGPIVTHTYTVPDPTTSISLTVFDSLGREFSTSKALSLLVVDFGYIYSRIRGKNTEVVPKKQQLEASDFALTVEGTPNRIWVARKGKSVREQSEKSVSNDRAFTMTHLYRATKDTSLTNDNPTRFRSLFRKTTDQSVSADIATNHMLRFAKTSDKSLATDKPSWTRKHVLQSVLTFLGKLTHKP